MKEQFEKNLEFLKNRPQRYLLDVKVKGRQYELEVYADTTLEKIIKRYVTNGFYDENESVTKVLVNGKQSAKSTKIKELVQGQLEKISNVKIQLIHDRKSKNEHYRNQSQPILQQSEVRVYPSKMLQNQKQSNSQYKAEPDKITAKQLELLIQSKQKKLQIQSRFKDYSKIIDKIIEKYNSQNIAKQKTLTNLKNFISFLGHKIQLFHKQRKVSKTGSKIMDQNSKKQISLDRSQKKITEQLELIMKLKENNTVSEQLISYFKQIRKIIKSKQQGQELALLNKKSESVNDQIKKISQSIVNDFKQMKNSQIKQSKEIQNLNEQIINLNDKINTLQKKLQKSKTIKQVNEGIKLRTSFINNLEQEKKIFFLKNEIQKYQNNTIDCLETVLEFNKCQIINFQIIVNLLDESSFSPFSRILMIIGVDNESFMIYSTKGIFRQGSSIKISQTEKGTTQNCCLAGAGFLILGNQLKKFTNSNGKLVNSIIKYNKKILSIGNRLNMLYSAKKKIEMIYKSSTQVCQLEDSNSELQNALKNKKLEVVSIQMYKVMLNYKNMCEASLTASTQATMSFYRKQYGQ